MISPVAKIAVRRMKEQLHKSILFSGTILFSVALASFFICFVQGFSVGDLAEGTAFVTFNRKLQQLIGITVFFLVAGAFFTVRDHSDMRRKERADVMAVLTSVGANPKQRRALLWAELCILCYPAVFVGALAGALVARLYTGSPISLLTVLIFFFVGCVFVSIFYFLPSCSFTKLAVIQSVKRQNPNADRATHGYRLSRTFRSQSLLRRLADKSVDYYMDTYRRIASALALACFYPVLSFLLIDGISNEKVVIDPDPFDGVDTTLAFFDAFDRILAFFLLAFLILALLGATHAILLIRAHRAHRKTQEKVYLSIGLTTQEYRRIGRYEIRGLALRAIAYFVVWVLLAYFSFRSV